MALPSGSTEPYTPSISSVTKIYYKWIDICASPSCLHMWVSNWWNNKQSKCFDWIFVITYWEQKSWGKLKTRISVRNTVVGNVKGLNIWAVAVAFTSGKQWLFHCLFLSVVFPFFIRSHIDARPHIAYTPGYRPSLDPPAASADLARMHLAGWLVGWLAGWLSVLTFQICSSGSSSSKLEASLRLLNEWDYAMNAHEVSERQKNQITAKRNR